MPTIFNPNKRKGVFMIPAGATKSPTPAPPSFSNTKSLAFDGVDELVDCGNDASRKVQTLTMSVWAKPTAFARDGILLNGHPSFGNQGILESRNPEI